MLSFDFSPKVNSQKTPILVPLFAEQLPSTARKPFVALSPLQKRNVRKALAQSNLPKKGIIPVFSAEAPVFVFLLSAKEFHTREAREAGMSVFCWAQKYRIDTLAIAEGMLTKEKVSAFYEGVILGSYEFTQWHGKKQEEARQEEVFLEKVQFIGPKNVSEKKRLEIMYEAVSWTKNIINMPPSHAHPTFLAQTAEDFAKQLPKVSVKILGEKELKKLGCGGILGVGQGSPQESRLIILEYKGGNKEHPLALVGKGVTYDTGGLSIKPSRNMRGMKQDLGGAATVLGAFWAIAKSAVKKNVLAVVPTVENAVSGESYKPDDVLRMYNGKTVEVTNTDAEGRLILADALAYTEEKYQPRAIVDLATLTGACAYAVGEDFTAGLSADQKLFDALQQSGEETNEAIWQLPLHSRYKKYLKSAIADIVNCSMKMKPGTIEGALFLQNFVTEKTSWCHLDIASVAFDDNTDLATGRNVRMLLNFVQKY